MPANIHLKDNWRTFTDCCVFGIPSWLNIWRVSAECSGFVFPHFSKESTIYFFEQIINTVSQKRYSKQGNQSFPLVVPVSFQQSLEQENKNRSCGEGRPQSRRVFLCYVIISIHLTWPYIRWLAISVSIAINKYICSYIYMYSGDQGEFVLHCVYRNVVRRNETVHRNTLSICM